MKAAAVKKWILLAGVVAVLVLLFWLVPLKIIGYFLLFMLGLMVLFLVAPVVLSVDYREGALKVKVRVLFVPITVWPFKQRAPKKEKKKAEPKEKTQQEKKEPKEKKPMEPAQMIDLAKRALSSLSAAMRFVLRGFWIRNVEVIFPIGGEDVAAIATTWGKLQQVIVTFQAFLENFINIKYDYVVLVPDYAEQYKGKQVFACKIIVSPLIMLIAAIAGGVHFLRYKKRGYTLQEYVEAQRLAQKAKAAAKPKTAQPGEQRSGQDG